MDFTHSSDRRMLIDTIDRVVADRLPSDARNRAAYDETGHSDLLWRALCELGVPGALFGEAAGGYGGGGFDIMAVFEAVGRGLVTEPLLGTLMTGTALAQAGGHDAMLARIVSGEAIAAFAHEDAFAEDGGVTRAVRDGAGWRIDGAKGVVPMAAQADVLIVAAHAAGGEALFVVPRGTAGLSVRDYAAIEGGRAGEVRLDGVMLDAAALVGTEDGGPALIGAAVAAGLLGLCAEALGAMGAANAMTIDYLRTRKQFGQPIGRFQALQHRMAAVLIEIEQARSAVINAAAAYDNADLRARDRALAAAKHTIGRVGTLVAEEAIQLHGGIAMTWELPLSHYAKRLVMIDHMLGDEDHHLQRYIALA